MRNVSKLVELGVCSANTNGRCIQGRIVESSKVFAPSLNMWVFMTADNDLTVPPKQAPMS